MKISWRRSMVRLASGVSSAVALFLGLLFAEPATLAQSILSTYVGTSNPVDGTQATTQEINYPDSVSPDASGGFYVGSLTMNAIYHVSSDGVINRVAGITAATNGYNGDGGPASMAQFSSVNSTALDGAGNLYINDEGGIRKIDSNGVITSIGASAEPYSKIAADGSGNVYFINRIGLIPEADIVEKVTTSGTVTTIAGTGACAAGTLGDGSAATASPLCTLGGVAVDSSGNVFIGDSTNYRIRKINAQGVISTVAGGGTATLKNNVSATSVQILANGIGIDAGGDLYISAYGQILKVNTQGLISIVAGNGTAGSTGDGGPGTAALVDPWSIAVGPSGAIYFPQLTEGTVRMINSAGVIQTVGGRGSYGYTGDGGPASLARMYKPSDIAMDSGGNLYIADEGNGVIRMVSAAGVITTVLAVGPTPGSNLDPSALAMGSNGTLYIGDNNSGSIVKFSSGKAAGTITVPGVSSFLRGGIAVGPDGSLYVAGYTTNLVFRVSASGVVSTFAGNGQEGPSGDGGLATAASLSVPEGVAIDSNGNVYIAGGGTLRKVTASGVISTIAGGGTGGVGDGAVALDVRFAPSAVTVDSAGTLFMSEADGVFKLTSDGVITLITGTLGVVAFSGDGYLATQGQINANWGGGLVIDPSGNLYLADGDNHRIRKITNVDLPATDIPFSLSKLGGISEATAGVAGTTTVGFAAVEPPLGVTPGLTPLSGLAIIGYTENGVLVTEASVPASTTLLSGRIYAEVNGPVNTGLALANPNTLPASVSFYFVDQNGNAFGAGTTTIPANGQIAAFLNQPPFNGGNSLDGTFNFTANFPIAAVALRGFTNERGDFLLTTLPVLNLAVPLLDAPEFPEYADGGGWTTKLVLVNPTSEALSGTVQFLNQSGQPAAVTIGGVNNDTFSYNLPPQGSQTFQTSGGAASTTVGSVFAYSSTQPLPTFVSGVAIFSYNNNGVTVTQSGVPGSSFGTQFWVYAESSGTAGSIGSIQTALAISSPLSGSTTVTVSAYNLDGSYTGFSGTLQMQEENQTSVFLNQISGLSGLPTPFKGFLSVTGSQQMTLIALRTRYNQRGDFLVATVPPVRLAPNPVPTSPIYFPDFADSGGYTTQFILYDTNGNAPSGSLQMYSQSGKPINLIGP